MSNIGISIQAEYHVVKYMQTDNESAIYIGFAQNHEEYINMMTSDYKTRDEAVAELRRMCALWNITPVWCGTDYIRYLGSNDLHVDV